MIRIPATRWWKAAILAAVVMLALAGCAAGTAVSAPTAHTAHDALLVSVRL